MEVRVLALRAGRPLPPMKSLVLISVRTWVDPRAIVRLEGLGQLKNPITSSGIEPATFRLVAQYLNLLPCSLRDIFNNFYLISLVKTLRKGMITVNMKSKTKTSGRTPWTGDQPIARPLPAHRATQTQNKRTQTSMPWVGFEPTICVRASEDSSCLKPRGHCDRLQSCILKYYVMKRVGLHYRQIRAWKDELLHASFSYKFDGETEHAFGLTPIINLVYY
jgi:hypothetical protein